MHPPFQQILLDFPTTKDPSASVVLKMMINEHYQIRIEMKRSWEMCCIVLFSWSTIDNEVSDTSRLKESETRFMELYWPRCHLLRLTDSLVTILAPKQVNIGLGKWNTLFEKSFDRFHWIDMNRIPAIESDQRDGKSMDISASYFAKRLRRIRGIQIRQRTEIV